MAKKVLVVDDEPTIVKGLSFSLEQDDMEVDCAYNGAEALELAKQNEYDMILLDVMLPEISGLEVCQQIRGFSDVPIIMLTAKGDDMDKILGLDYGADDYITKPFNILEVKARIKAISRRFTSKTLSSTPYIIKKRDLEIDLNNRNIKVAGKPVSLTAREFDILELLATNAEKIYSREELLKIIWGDSYLGDARTVDVHVRRLREKMEEDASNPKYIQTRWGVGYFFKV